MLTNESPIYSAMRKLLFLLLLTGSLTSSAQDITTTPLSEDFSMFDFKNLSIEHIHRTADSTKVFLSASQDIQRSTGNVTRHYVGEIVYDQSMMPGNYRSYWVTGAPEERYQKTIELFPNYFAADAAPHFPATYYLNAVKHKANGQVKGIDASYYRPRTEQDKTQMMVAAGRFREDTYTEITNDGSNKKSYWKALFKGLAVKYALTDTETGMVYHLYEWVDKNDDATKQRKYELRTYGPDGSIVKREAIEFDTPQKLSTYEFNHRRDHFAWHSGLQQAWMVFQPRDQQASTITVVGFDATGQLNARHEVEAMGTWPMLREAVALDDQRMAFLGYSGKKPKLTALVATPDEAVISQIDLAEIDGKRVEDRLAAPLMKDRWFVRQARTDRWSTSFVEVGEKTGSATEPLVYPHFYRIHIGKDNALRSYAPVSSQGNRNPKLQATADVLHASVGDGVWLVSVLPTTSTEKRERDGTVGQPAGYYGSLEHFLNDRTEAIEGRTLLLGRDTWFYDAESDSLLFIGYPPRDDEQDKGGYSPALISRWIEG